MKNDFTMRSVRISLIEESRDIKDIAQLVRDNIKGDRAWLLMETKEKFVFKPLAQTDIDKLAALPFKSLIIFSPQAELRAERQGSSPQLWLRLLYADPQGEEYYARALSPLLRDGSGGRLLYEEYFRPDSSGFLLKSCGRLCGVEEK